MAIPNFKEPLEEARSNSRVLILGSYSQSKEAKGSGFSEKSLESLKGFMVSKGFVQTKLVRDWTDEQEVPSGSLNIHFGMKSYYYIDNWADILLFVFLPEFDNYGVTREWGHLVESNVKCDKAIILTHSSINLGALIKGDIESKRILSYTFDNERELLDFAFSGCFNVIYTLMSKAPN